MTISPLIIKFIQLILFPALVSTASLLSHIFCLPTWFFFAIQLAAFCRSPREFSGLWPAGKLPSLSSYHVILQHLSCSQWVVQVQRKRTKRDCNRIKNSASNSTQIVRGAKQQCNTFCKVTLAYILRKTSCNQEVTSTILLIKRKNLVIERIISGQREPEKVTTMCLCLHLCWLQRWE